MRDSEASKVTTSIIVECLKTFWYYEFAQNLLRNYIYIVFNLQFPIFISFQKFSPCSTRAIYGVLSTKGSKCLTGTFTFVNFKLINKLR